MGRAPRTASSSAAGGVNGSSTRCAAPPLTWISSPAMAGAVAQARAASTAARASEARMVMGILECNVGLGWKLRWPGRGSTTLRWVRTPFRRLPPAVLLVFALIAASGCGGGGNDKDAQALLDKA